MHIHVGGVFVCPLAVVCFSHCQVECIYIPCKHSDVYVYTHPEASKMDCYNYS